MRIESRGVDITDVPGVERITVERDSMVIDMEAKIGRYGVDQVRAIRDALTAALAKYDALTSTDHPAEHKDAVFRLGQELAGDEDLPLGAVVTDGDGDRWYHLAPGLYSTDRGATDPSRTLHVIVSCYRGAKIVSLP